MFERREKFERNGKRLTSQKIMFGNLGTTELIIIAVIIIVLFGAKKLPELAKGLGQGIREFKKEVNIRE